MKKFLLAVLLTAAVPSYAQTQAASEASIRELMTITKSREVMDRTYAQLDGYMETAMTQALAGKEINDAQNKVLAEFRGKVVEIIKDEMGWERLEPVFVDLYRKTLSQKEVDGIVTFYKSEPGKAVIEKMPVVMDELMKVVMERMQAVSPRLQGLQGELEAKLKAASEK